MSLSRIQEQVLRISGFTPYEVRQVAEGKTPDGQPQAVDLKSDIWQVAIRRRKGWVQTLKKRGYSDQDVVNHILWFYDTGQRVTIWDFIRQEYSKSQFGSISVNDYQNKRSTNARRRVKRLYSITKVRGS